MGRYSSSRGIGHSYDWKLIGIYLALVLIGLANIYSSVISSEPSSVFDTSVRSGMQCIWIATSFGLAVLILFIIPARIWETGSVPLYLGVLFLLFAVIFVGSEVKGSHSWFNFGAVKFQPAEISKITTSLLLALIMSQPGFKISRAGDFVKIALIIGLPMLAILAEKETGSALVYIGFLFVLYREGMSGWILTFIGIIIVLFIVTLTASPFTAILVLISAILAFNLLQTSHKAINILIAASVIIALALIGSINLTIILCFTAIPALLYYAYRKRNSFVIASVIAGVVGIIFIFSTDIIFNKVLGDHQRKRIEVLLGMKEDPSGVGYNVNQSMIAIGSGGFTGKGYLQGTQTSYGFVPEQSTDFIFCTVGEEWGFVGCLVVISLYFMLILRIINDAEKSREHFTRIYGYCVAACLFMHLFINIGMTIGIMPVIGIPLPMMSYGGSSLWAFTIMIFIFLVLDHQEKKYF